MASEGFFERVYEVVEQIPEGMVATYGQVALLAGRPRSARYVGYALHSNPRPGEIPCHRVVFADGRICEGFAFGGPDAQRELLLGEGVAFKDDMHVDLAAFRWPAGLKRLCRGQNHHKGACLLCGGMSLSLTFPQIKPTKINIPIW